MGPYPRKPKTVDGKTYTERIKEEYGKMTPDQLMQMGMSQMCIERTITILKSKKHGTKKP